MEHKVDIWTDGACFPNPGNGGWCAILVYGEHRKELVGSKKDTTNNEMEMMAVLKGLEALKFPCEVTIHTDSQLVKNWMTGEWACNHDHIRRLRDEILSLPHNVTYKWVKAHSGIPFNERANTLAEKSINA